MEKYTHIILDETHERELDMDLLMTLIKNLHLFNSMHTKIILMSATLDEDLLMEYFTYHPTIVPEIVKIDPKRRFAIRELYLDDLNQDLQDASITAPIIRLETYEAGVKIIKLQLAKSQNSILVFLPGIYEIFALYTMLQNDKEIENASLLCILHSSLPVAEQEIAFKQTNKPKIVLSSNIAESSVTIKEIDCVIDFCLTKYIDVNGQSTNAALKLDWASQESLKQRAGRTGRTCDGTVIRMIFRSFFNDLREKTIPEMMRCPLETVVLHVKMLQDIPTQFLRGAPSPPKESAVLKALNILKELGGIQRLTSDGMFDSRNGEITFAGHIMAALPLDVRVSKFIILGYAFSVLDEAIIIAAGMTVKNIFINNYRSQLDNYVRKLSWADGSGCDFIAILNAYSLWSFSSEQGHFINWKEEKNWCDRFNLDRKSLHEMRNLINNIKFRLKGAEIESTSGSLAVKWLQKEKPLVLKICLAGAFLSNFFIVGDSSEVKEMDIYKTFRAKNPLNTIILKCKDPISVGEVYEDQIKKKFVASHICNDINEVEVEFEKGSSKIFVSFPKSQSIDSGSVANESLSSISVPGKVAPEVYKALKLFQTGHKFTVDTMSERDAEKYAVEHGLGKLSDYGEFKANRNYFKHPGLVVIPTTCTKELLGVVSHVEHIGKLFIQPKFAEFRLRKQIEDSLPEEGLTAFEIKDLKRNQLVIVYHKFIKRAKVVYVNHSTKNVTCLLYDFGVTIKLPSDHVFIVPESVKHIYDISPQCFEASLYGIEPAIYKCAQGKWTQEANEKFKEFVLDKTFKVEVYSVISEVAKVTLVTRERVNINLLLIEKGYAHEYEENYNSKYDQKIRHQNQSTNSNFFDAKEEFEQRENKFAKIEVPSPPRDRCTNVNYAYGPTTPLEVKTVRSTLVEASNEVKISPLSVNSVLLLDDPGNFYGRILVSSQPTTNGREFILHQTSLMPNVPGIAELLSLLFAPAVSFIRDETMTRYAAIRFGLGARDDGSPFFVEHDSILPVNVQISVDDLEEINKLRLALSTILLAQPKQELLTVEVKSKLMKNIRSLIVNIFSKTRPVLPPIYTSVSRKWEMSETDENTPDFPNCAEFSPISYPPLYSYDAKLLREKLNDFVEEMNS